MKLKRSIRQGSLQNHLRYHFWVYVLIAGLSFLLWGLVYTQTSYRPPQDKRIDLYIQGGAAQSETVNEYLRPIWEETVPEMEAVQAVMLLSPGGQNDYYATTQLTVYLSAAEGDIYILTSEDFKRLASQGVFVNLSDYIDNGLLDLGDLDLSAGRVAQVQIDAQGQAKYTGTTGLYGIPAKELYGFAKDLMIDNRDLVMAIALNSGNEENAVRFLEGLVRHTLAPKPDFFE